MSLVRKRYAAWANALDCARLRLECFREVTMLQPTWFFHVQVSVQPQYRFRIPLVFESGCRLVSRRVAMESVLESHVDRRESLELSIVRIGLETYRSYESRTKRKSIL